MATTQYIGARYVPLFYTNPDDNSNNWKSGVAYDPLTVVTDLNQSYTSKIQVPASVGRPSENPTYWILTGAYSAQVEQYRQEVVAVREDMENIETKVNANKILFVGDSYNTIYPGEGWDTEFIRQAGLSASDYFKIDIAGLGFATSPSWTNALLNRLDQIEDKELYTAVIVCGGTNDRSYTQAQLISAMELFQNTVKANFPNARMYVGFIGWSGIASQHTGFRSALNNYIEACNSLGIAYLHNVEYVLHWKPYLRDNQSVTPGDYFHPTSAGLVALGGKILDAYMTGTCTVKYSDNLTLTADGTNVTSIAGDTCSVAMDNNVTTVTLGAQTINFASAVTALAGKVIGTFSCNCFDPVSVLNALNAMNVSTSNATPLNWVFNGGNISIAPYGPISAGNHRSMPAIWTFPTTSC